MIPSFSNSHNVIEFQYPQLRGHVAAVDNEEKKAKVCISLTSEAAHRMTYPGIPDHNVIRLATTAEEET